VVAVHVERSLDAQIAGLSVAIAAAVTHDRAGGEQHADLGQPPAGSGSRTSAFA